MARNLKPERWGSLLVQEKYAEQKEKACDKRHNNNNNNKPVFLPLCADHDLLGKTGFSIFCRFNRWKTCA